MTQTQTAEIIWDKDHGIENEGYYVRLHSDGQDEDIQLEATTEEAAKSEVATGWPDAEIISCDEPADAAAQG